MRLASLLLLCAMALPGQNAPNGPVILFIGPPGSGKTTQAAAAAKKHKLPVIARQDLIAVDPAAFQKNRPKAIQGMTEESDPFLNQLFARKLAQADVARGFILDGYPATKDHADFVAKLVREGRLPNPIVIQLDIPDDVVMKRMKSSHEATDGVLQQRIKDYHREMDMLKLYFPNATVETVDATAKAGKVTKRVEEALKKHLPK
jgi:adenylate kinase